VIAVQVDNEYLETDDIGQPGKVGMMVQLEKAFRAGGITVPLTFNDAYQGGNFAHGPGKVDIYGVDDYPLGFDCSHPDVWVPVRTNYDDFHRTTNPDQPLYIPEFQGGAFDACAIFCSHA
jgi:hypothetical protein